MLQLVILWALWCCLHSFLISNRAHRVASSLLGRWNRYYRLAYNIFATISLLPILYYQYLLTSEPLFSWHGPWRILQILLLAYAAVLFYLGAKVYDLDFFLGLRQIREKGSNSLPFQWKGVLQYVRHPWYSGGLPLLWSYSDISDVDLVSRSILSAYLVIGTLLEERRLKHELGEPYREYCRQVPMLLPWTFITGRVLR
jgi:protein-S-isoprenylcysteine O-methyltransferase Ste14